MTYYWKTAIIIGVLYMLNRYSCEKLTAFSYIFTYTRSYGIRLLASRFWCFRWSAYNMKIWTSLSACARIRIISAFWRLTVQKEAWRSANNIFWSNLILSTRNEPLPGYMAVVIAKLATSFNTFTLKFIEIIINSNLILHSGFLKICV